MDDGDFRSKSQMPTKGKLKDAEDNTVRNRIKLHLTVGQKPTELNGHYPLIYPIFQMTTMKEMFGVCMSSHLQTTIQSCHRL